MMEKNMKFEGSRSWMMSLFFFVFLWISVAHAQQSYVNNHQLDCNKSFTETDGFQCNGPKACLSYLTFRSAPPSYDSPPSIGYLLNSEPSQIAAINQVSDVNKISKGTILIVPVNCSCSALLYQHNATYTLKSSSETYFSLASNTYQGLTTCHSLIAQNPSYNYHNLSVGLDLHVPLPCACPTSNQTAAGFNYLLSYLVTSGDSISSIAQTFGVDDLQSIYDANRLSSSDSIYPFTPILVPLKNPPSKIQTTVSPPPALPPSAAGGESGAGAALLIDSSQKWIYIGPGAVAALLILVVAGLMVCFFCRRRRRRRQSVQVKPVWDFGGEARRKFSKTLESQTSWSVSSEGIRFAIASLTVYNYQELQTAAGYFGEANRIKGSVYRASFKGDDAAIKILNGDVSGEINILKQINHNKVIRLSGFCIHGGNTYLVYEYAENGALSDWLHCDGDGESLSSSFTLGWKQRVQIAYDAADALNYLHNFVNPLCIHKNLKSSNILLDGNMRGKVTNFGLARRLENEEEGMQLTRHVVGTQGYMAPEYIENGVVTPKLDVFAFGVVILELLSGKEAAAPSQKTLGRELPLALSINQVLEGDNVRDKLRGFIDPSLAHHYPFDLAFSMAQLAHSCVAPDVNVRPTISHAYLILSKIHSSSLRWDLSNDFQASGSLIHGR